MRHIAVLDEIEACSARSTRCRARCWSRTSRPHNLLLKLRKHWEASAIYRIARGSGSSASSRRAKPTCRPPTAGDPKHSEITAHDPLNPAMALEHEQVEGVGCTRIVLRCAFLQIVMLHKAKETRGIVFVLGWIGAGPSFPRGAPAGNGLKKGSLQSARRASRK